MKREAESQNLPEGTVTFLFTDIEGSTELLKRLGDKYAVLLADQRRIMRAIFDAHGGQEVDTQGDSFFVSFPRASQAVSAAVEIQRALRAHTWPEKVGVRVRVGLHTGEPIRAGEGYVGMDVHRTARIAHAGHGGQVLLSPTTHALVAQDLPEGLRLKDLGEHRLKDLQHSLRLSQLMIPEMESIFPPLKTIDALPNNLPVQLTSFIGREDEILKVKELLHEARLVTLVGPGGAGKTRLSLQAAAELAEGFPHGVWFVELSAVETPDEIVPAIAEALRFNIDSYTSQLGPLQQLIDFLSLRSCLLVMDNFEHLIAGAELMRAFLENAPNLRFLVTSRERLNLHEEWTLDIGGMEYPQNGREAHKAYSALQLFEERARQVKDGFTLTQNATPDVIRICKLMGGSPLGIELAASWMSTLSCGAIVDEIEKNLDFLASTMKDLPERHRSMRAVFDHSWKLLSEEQRLGFARLAVFRGSFSRQAAEQVAAVNLAMLADFVRKSLVRPSVQDRYQVHELLRQFAHERLELDVGKHQAVNEKHSRFYAHLLLENRYEIERERMLQIREAIRPDINNLKEAIYHACRAWDVSESRVFLRDFAVYFRAINYHEGLVALHQLSQRLRTSGLDSEPGSTGEIVMLAIQVFECAFEGSLGLSEHQDMAEKILPRLRRIGLAYELGVCLLALGIYCALNSDHAGAIDYLSESISRLEPLDDLFGLASSMSWLGWVYDELGELDRGGAIYRDAYALCKREGCRLGQAYTLSKLGTWADACQAYEEALAYHQEAQAIFIEFADLAGQGYALSRMSLSAWGLSNFKDALHYAHQGLDAFESIGHRWGINVSYCRMGFAEVGLGKLENALAHLKRGLSLGLENHFPALVSYALIGVAAVRIHEGRCQAAAELLGYAKAQQTTPSQYLQLAELELAKLQAHLSPEGLHEGLARGAKADVDQLMHANQLLGG